MSTQVERRVDRLEQLVNWIKGQLAQLFRRVAALEDQARAGQGGGYAGGGGGGGRGRVAYTTSAITARSGATAGTGDVQPKRLDSGDLVDEGDELTVYNAGAAIADGKYVMYWIDPEGVCWVEPEECS